MKLAILLFSLLIVASGTGCEIERPLMPGEVGAGITPLQLAIWPSKPQIQLAPENWDVYGIRLDLLYGENYHVAGLDIGMINTVHFRGAASGVQVGLIYNDAYNLTGVQIGLLISETERANGLQVTPLINHASKLHGAQIGLVNFSDENSCGVQIGLLNFMKDGFLPFFPLINFNFSLRPAEE
jgi:hypothetical protein